MTVLDFEAYAKCREEINKQKKVIENLLKANAELEEKVNAIFGAYETLQYSCEGRCSMYGTELEKLRKHIKMLEEELGNKTE
jgi:predicted RNase H-like nuclease (RuvC/YqgF family)